MENGFTGERYIPLEEAKTRIIAVLGQFHPDLGERAANILYDNERMNIKEISFSQPLGMMQYRPVGVTKEYLEQNDMLCTDQEYKERFGGEPFTEQDNREGPGVIDLAYNGTPDAVIYLVHELGHAIADDIQIEKGFKHNDFKTDETRGGSKAIKTNPKEKQAYFVQNIFTHYTGQESPESLKVHSKNNGEELCLLSEWENSREGKVSKERIKEYEEAKETFETSLNLSTEGRKALITHALGGNGPLADTVLVPTYNTTSSKVDIQLNQ